jgi:hypothetical protein
MSQIFQKVAYDLFDPSRIYRSLFWLSAFPINLALIPQNVRFQFMNSVFDMTSFSLGSVQNCWNFLPESLSLALFRKLLF